MRTAIIGGSFNPPHIGHLQLVEEVRMTGYERIFLVPSYISPHKEPVFRPTPEDRLEMTRLAAGIARADVESCEVLRTGVSYSIDTVRYFMSHYEITGKPAVIIGDDLLDGFHSWKEARELARISDILVARRTAVEQKAFVFPHVRLDNAMIAVSSSQIRDLRRKGKAYKFLVPLPVFDYIETHDLYTSCTGRI